VTGKGSRAASADSREKAVKFDCKARVQAAFWMVRQTQGVECYHRIDTQGADGEVWALVASDCERAARSYAVSRARVVEAVSPEQFAHTLLLGLTRMPDPEWQWLYFLDPVAEGEKSATGTVISLPWLVDNAALHELHRESEEIRQGIVGDGQHRSGLAGHPAHGPYRRLLTHVLANVRKARMDADADARQPEHQSGP
jgi:hypothetical protein